MSTVSISGYERREHTPGDPDPDAVMTFPEWCKLNGISPATGERLRRAGHGPRFIKLSPKRLGVTRRENRRWQDSRIIETAAA